MLDDWLFPETAEGVHDVFAVGFQETVDLNAVNVTMDSRNKERADYWDNVVHFCLNRKAPFTMVCSLHLVGISLCVFVKNSLLPYVSDVKSCAVGVGVMGVLGNKVSTSLSLSVCASTLAIFPLVCMKIGRCVHPVLSPRLLLLLRLRPLIRSPRQRLREKQRLPQHHRQNHLLVKPGLGRG